jgi:hypothetical protein
VPASPFTAKTTAVVADGQDPGNPSSDLSDCVTLVAQAFATGPSAAFANAGYVAAGVGLRDQGSGSIATTGIPSGAYIARAYLYWASINPSDPHDVDQ